MGSIDIILSHQSTKAKAKQKQNELFDKINVNYEHDVTDSLFEADRQTEIHECFPWFHINGQV